MILAGLISIAVLIEWVKAKMQARKDRVVYMGRSDRPTGYFLDPS